MTGSVTPVGGGDTFTTMKVANPEPSVGKDFTLSDAARSTLDMIGKMQGDFNREISTARGVASPPDALPGAQAPTDVPADRMVAAAEMMGRQIDAFVQQMEFSNIAARNAINSMMKVRRRG